MGGPQPDHDQHIQDFHLFIDSVRCHGTCTPQEHRQSSFIPKSVLRQYFKNPYNASKLLRTLYPDVESSLDPRSIWRHSKVFSILLLIGKGHYIRNFVRHSELQDKSLPFGIRPKSFPRDTADPDFFAKFYDKQWEFCPPKFEPNMEMQFRDQDVLPILQQNKIAQGGSASVYKILLHKDYNRLHTEDSPPPKFESEDEANTFILKRFEGPDAEKDYTSEVSGFKKIRHSGSQPNIIRFYADFTYGGTANIILEYANGGTLEQYWQDVMPPSSAVDKLTFWTRLFGLLSGLMSIHGVEWNDSEESQPFQGWHQDLKPSNILVKYRPGFPYDCEFKIADLALSHFKRKSPSHKAATDKDRQGTRIYGAPERYTPILPTEHIPLQVTKTVDVWSLGCIFSEAAYWEVHGWVGLVEYRRRRKVETEKISGFRDSCCFHNGYEVLRVVRATHENLAREKRASNHISAGPDVHRMIVCMLQRHESRPDAEQLYDQAKQTIERASRQLGLSANNSRYLYASRSGQAPLHVRQLPPIRPPDLISSSPVSPTQLYTTSSFATSPDNVSQEESSEDFTPLYSPLLPGTPRQAIPYPQQDRHHPRVVQRDFDPVELESLDLGQIHDRADVLDDGSPERMFFPPDQSYRHQLPSSSQKRRKKSMSSLLDAQMHHLPKTSYADLPYNKVKTRRANTTWEPSQGRPTGQGSDQVHALGTLRLHSKDAASKVVHAVSPTLSSGSRKQELPTLSVSALRYWHNHRKFCGKDTGERLPYEHHMEDLKKRDHVFLIDTSITMQQFWTQMVTLVGLLGYLLKECDPDGIEMYFTMSDEHCRAKHSYKLVETLRKHKPPLRPSNIRQPLQTILEKYQRKLNEREHGGWRRRLSGNGPPVRPQNLYVLTDGVWQPECDVKDIIEDFVNCLKKHECKREKFGIEFISFGNDKEGLDRLARLDSKLGLAMDIVDTEPSDGNVWKMLLGSNNPWFDGDDENCNAPK